jgi:ABC-type uncharacterized transport system substrate-binding protein
VASCRLRASNKSLKPTPPAFGLRGGLAQPLYVPAKWRVEGNVKLTRLPILVTLAAACLAAPLGVGAQQQVGKPSRIGVLLNLYPPDTAPPQALRQRLRDLGYTKGENLVIDWRYQLGGNDRLHALAAELVRLKPDVVVADITVAIRAAMQATSTIPIVMANSADAVGGGLVASLGRPGGNVTGVTIMLAELTANACSSSKK